MEGSCAVDRGACLPGQPAAEGAVTVQPPSCPAHSSGVSPPDLLTCMMGKLSQQNILRLYVGNFIFINTRLVLLNHW